MRILPSNSGLFVVFVCASLLPVLWFSYLPSGDGPAHVYNAALISRYLFRPADPVRRFLEFNASFPPNWLAHGLLALLMALMSPHAAERVFVASYVLCLPLALRYAMRASSRQTHGVEFLALPLVFNMHLHWGFYGFIAGLVAYLVAVGYWLRVREQPPALRSLGLMAALVILIYLCHPVPLLEFWLTAGFLWAIGATRSKSWRVSEARTIVLASIPAACLYVHYILTRPAAPPVPVSWPTWRYSSSTLVKLFPLATYTAGARFAAMALSAVVAAAIVWAWTTKFSHRTGNDHLYVSAALVGLVFVAPTQAAGGTLITSRLVYFPLFLTLIWLAAVKWPARYSMGFVIAGGVLALAGQVSRWPIYQRYDQRMQSFLEMGMSREGQPVEFFQTESPRTTVDLDTNGTPYLAEGAWGYIAANRNTLLLSDYEPRVGTFPFSFRPGASPAAYWLVQTPGCEGQRRWIDTAGYRKNSGLTIDTQMMWIDDEASATEACIHTDGRSLTAERHSADGKLLWLDDPK